MYKAVDVGISIRAPGVVKLTIFFWSLYFHTVHRMSDWHFKTSEFLLLKIVKFWKNYDLKPQNL